MARTIRHARLESRTARAHLAKRNAPYWVTLTKGRALGYRKGSNGGASFAKYRVPTGERLQLALGAADDAMDADTIDVLTFSAAQSKARDWFAQLDRNAGRRPARYTVGDALDDYLYNFTGKSVDKTRYTIERYLRPKLGDIEVIDLTTERLRQFQEELASSRAVYRANR